MQENYTNTLCHLNAMPLSVALLVGKADKAKMGQCLGGGLLSLSLSLSLSSLALFGRLKFLNALFLGFCALFVILSLLQKGEKSKGLKAHLLFLDTSLTLSMTKKSVQYGKQTLIILSKVR